MGKIAKVYFNKNIWSGFSYKSDSKTFTAQRVFVEFGKKETIGFIEKEEASEENSSRFKLKKILKYLDKEEYLKSKDIEFIKEISKSYLIPLGKIFKLYSPPFYTTKKPVSLEQNTKKRELKLFCGYNKEIVLKELKKEIEEDKTVLLILNGSNSEHSWKRFIDKELKISSSILDKTSKAGKKTYEDYFFSKSKKPKIIIGKLLPIFLPVLNRISIFLIGESAGDFYYTHPINADLKDISIKKSEIFNSNFKVFSHFPSLKIVKYFKENRGEIIEKKDKKQITVFFNTKKRHFDKEIKEFLWDKIENKSKVLLISQKKNDKGFYYCPECRMPLDKKELSEDEKGALTHKKCKRKIAFIKPFGKKLIKEKVKKLFSISEESNQFIKIASINELEDLKTELFKSIVWFYPEEQLKKSVEGSELILSSFRKIKSLLDENGELIIKTGIKNFYAYEFLNKPVFSFYKEEMKIRKELNYYPFNTFITIVFEGKNIQTLVKRAKKLINEIQLEDEKVYGPFIKKGKTSKSSFVIETKKQSLTAEKILFAIKKSSINPTSIIINKNREF